ncbi:MAG TPA: M1 family metallopeptidase [Longimicrobiaceae bacterium]|nr:M1 family metallopeptidase [Longimicrobiaceae bacterium]
MIIPLLALLVAPQVQDTAYFQQDVEYRIEAKLDDAAEVLHGRARMTYTNRSSDTLDRLYFHLYLNAFRPNSAWARRELEFGERRFQDLGPEELAYERLTSVEVEGTPVQPIYPGAPDSTVVEIPLPEPLAPGETVEVDLAWDARPSTLPRRQGRRGRHYDFAQWFPIVAVYDEFGWEQHPLMPQGEFYGEFMNFDVTLDVAADQVIGATGVPVAGDPGWSAAAAPGYADSMFFKRDVYGSPGPAEALGLLDTPVEADRKRVRWLAEDVHNFAWSTSPDYIYEGGHWEDVAIHVLYQPGDTAWDEGVALRRTKTALAWLDDIYGDFAWPQITNVHRVEGGGTEFPMMVMNGSASLGLILHEVGHNYTMGILASNEWKEGFLDEGMSSFQTNWYAMAHGEEDVWDGAFERVAEWELAGMSQPLTTESADFRDFRTYQAMTYTKPSVVYRMLQAYLGDETFREGLHIYYENNKLQHVTLEDLEAAMEEAAGDELDWFFDQWFRTTKYLDYGIGSVEVDQLAGGDWRTRVEIIRMGQAWMPVVLKVGDETRELESHDVRQVVEVVTSDRPAEIVLDPGTIILDADRSNNRWPS